MPKLRHIGLLTITLAGLCACKSFEYEADSITTDDNSIHVANVGFQGFNLEPSDRYELLSQAEWQQAPGAHEIQTIHNSFRDYSRMDYHFHQHFVYRKGEQLIYFVPFQLKSVRKFRFTPPDRLERFLIDWVRRAEFEKIIDYDLNWRAESDAREHSTVILNSKAPQDGWVFEERIMTGDLKEMFIFAGFAPADEADSLSKALLGLQQSLEVIR